MSTEMYTEGDYLKKNPTWHVQDSPWKAIKILEMLKRNNINPCTICEVGCGAGEILRQLQGQMSKECTFLGYEISPQAFELSKQRTNEKLHFELKDITKEQVYFDLILIIDLIEHVENYYDFLRQLEAKSKYKILHIPLDLSVQSILRRERLLTTRKGVGHIHYFTKETALQTLVDVGYEVIDHFYTAGSIDLKVQSIKAQLAKIPRKVLYAITPDLAVRIMGGYSLMVLVK